MSKAFTREDDLTEEPVLAAPVSLLPAGARNYLTAEGKVRLEAELRRIQDDDRPPLLAASATDREAKGKLARLEQRIRHLQQSLKTAEVVAAPEAGAAQVRFGATVTVRDQRGEKSIYRLVGVDEADYARNEVSWQSPIAKALLNARLDEKVPFKFPRGVAELEIVRIE